ncbi:MAG: outer membrane protein assembly factor BamB, partial [Verrucomicrobiales bacterium]
FYGGLFYTARAPMVAMDGKVWAVNKDQQLLEMDGETGEVLRTMKTKHMTAHLMAVDGVMVAATWKGGDDVGAKKGIDRRPLDIEITEGTIEGFSLDSGEKLWETAHMATSIRSADGRVYLVHRTGSDNFEIAKALKAKRRGEDVEKEADANRGEQTVVALDMKTGELIWEVKAEDLGAKSVDHIAVSLAGMGGVTVSKNTYAITQSTDSSGKEAIWLNGETGEAIVKRANAGFPVIYEGAVHLGGVAFDPASGEIAEGVKGVSIGATVCTPQVYVNGIKTNNRSLRYDDNGEAKTFGAARGSCMFAGIPANGAFYTAQTYCACAPGTAPGFIAFGPIGTEPTREEVIAGSKLVKGPSYGKQSGDGVDGWFTFMGNAERGSSNPNAEIPSGELSIAWQTKIAAPMTDSNVEGSWKDSLAGLTTAPVVSGGHVFTADLHRRKVIMSGASDGEVVWETHVGGRVSTPPTVFGDLCLIGAADGYVYALDKTDGSLAWKLRMAPAERRMVSYAQVESPWKVFSSVLVDENGVAYASAGRSTGAESGIVVRAFQPKTGEVIWSETIAYPEGSRADHINDVMYLKGDELYLMKSVFDRKTGEQLPNRSVAYDLALRDWGRARNEAIKAEQPEPAKPEPPVELAMHNHGIEGLANPNWTKLGNRRRRDTSLDGVRGTVLAFDEATIVNSSQGFDRKDGKALWHSPGQNEQVTAIALGKNAVVYGGGFFPEDGSEQGFVRIVNRETGEVTGIHRFPAPLSFQSLAIEGGKIFATFEDGQLVCLGE